MAQPRVALFADTFHEVNGAARTCREWHSFAQRRRMPFLCVRWGSAPRLLAEGSVWTLDLVRSFCAIPVDPDLSFDPCFYRDVEPVAAALERFRPDIVHVTSPGDMGILGAILAARLKTRFTLSWHTNLHEFAARRVSQLLSWVPSSRYGSAARTVERFVMDRVCWFFGRGEMIFAPNPELISLLHARTGKPVFPMGRGVDTELFHPARRTRTDATVVLGFVGRLMPEKNLRLLLRVDAALRAAGIDDFRFQFTGSGSEREWLERQFPRAQFTGVLTGQALARAYANLDIFVFPSRTDTFGNVVQEALASGVPAVVTDAGGPRFIVQDGITGYVASTDDQFCERAVAMARDPALRRQMAGAARQQVAHASWDRVLRRFTRAMTAPAPALDGETVASAAYRVVTHPWQTFVRDWNWKAALLSALFRGLLFAGATLRGPGAMRGVWIGLLFRLAVGGFFGSLLQAFRAARPAWLAGLCIALLLPGAAHSLEFLALTAGRATHIKTGMIVSIAVSAVSLLFNWLLMRHGLLVTDGGRRS
jgi:phosphatidylinositol alpha 1,6-mannosyltransferase